jgi:hypothetical protein
MATAPPRTKAHLLKTRTSPSWLDVELTLCDTNLVCTARDYSAWVDEELGLADYRAKVSAGDPVVLFDFQRDRLSITWLRQFYRGGFQVSQDESRRWLVALVQPSGFGGVLDLMTDRAVWRQWRAALPDTPGGGRTLEDGR